MNPYLARGPAPYATAGDRGAEVTDMTVEALRQTGSRPDQRVVKEIRRSR